MATQSPLELLAESIQEMGVWTWYASKFPDIMQIEFDRTQLYIPPVKEGLTPRSKVALQFLYPQSVSIWMKDGHSLPVNWLTLFNQDQAGPYQVDSGKVSFDMAGIKELLKTKGETQTLHGSGSGTPGFWSNDVLFGFIAGDVGMFIGAKQIRVLSEVGEFKLTQIPELNEKWWDYWEEYWEAKVTAYPLPYDVACEMVVPAGKE